MSDRKVPRSKEDLKKFRDEIVHQFHVVSEGVIDQVKLVADGVATVNNQLDRTRKELKEEIDNKTQPIAQAVLELSGRVNALDSRVIALDSRVIALDSKVDRVHEELKAEIKETRQEILAAVKFSYAELDKRITTLEKEFLELKRRVEKIETRSMS
jgi:predicted RNase H-like nuclease (RuvC/YqgF family)